MDRDFDGTLDFEEFSRLMTARLQAKALEGKGEDESFREAFGVFDKDGSGKISRDELRKIVTCYGRMRLSEADADEMLSAADADGDGLIDYEEFVKLFTDMGNSMAAGQ